MKGAIPHIELVLAAVAFVVMLASAPGQAPSASTDQPKQDRRIAITVDDLPGAVPGSDKAVGNLRDLQHYNRAIIKVLQEHNAPAVGLVIGNKMEVPGERDARAGILNEWVKAGFDLGNHTYSHLHFKDMTLEQFEDDTLRGDVVTRAVLAANGKSERYFRYPGFSEGPTPAAEKAFEDFLQSHGLEIAPVSVEDADYQFNDVLANARAHNDKQVATKTKALYLAHALEMFDWVEGRSRQRFGREIPEVLLIHDNEINAEMLNTLLTYLEHRGYRFISLEDALSDPVYTMGGQSDGSLGRCYMCWGAPGGPRPPAWITAQFRAMRKANSN
jgi:peptidoglycan/xylan/chitin deacetylase (PgdA/CDA1 family)